MNQTNPAIFLDLCSQCVKRINRTILLHCKHRVIRIFNNESAVLPPRAVTGEVINPDEGERCRRIECSKALHENEGPSSRQYNTRLPTVYIHEVLRWVVNGDLWRVTSVHSVVVSVTSDLVCRRRYTCGSIAIIRPTKRRRQTICRHSHAHLIINSNHELHHRPRPALFFTSSSVADITEAV